MRRYPSRVDNSTLGSDYNVPEWQRDGQQQYQQNAYTPMTLNPSIQRETTTSNRHVLQKYQGQLQQTTYQDYNSQPEGRARRQRSSSSRQRLNSPAHSPDDRSKKLHEGILYDFYESKPLTRDIYSSNPTTATQSTPNPNLFESRAKELEKRLPTLYPSGRRGAITFEEPSIQTRETNNPDFQLPRRIQQQSSSQDNPQLDQKPYDSFVKFDNNNGNFNTQLTSMNQPLIGSDDSFDTSTYEERARRGQTSTPRHSLTKNLAETKKYADAAGVEFEAMQYLRDKKRKTGKGNFFTLKSKLCFKSLIRMMLILSRWNQNTIQR